MTPRNAPTRLFAAATIAALSLLLAGCLISPGKFAASLDLHGDDRFSFSYDGEIYVLGLSQLARMGAAAEPFEPSVCYDEDTYEDRDCTKEELTEQRAEWEAGAEARAAEAKRKAEQLSALMGGIAPSDPEASEKLAALLLRHEGWQRVEPRGDGLFDISYRIEGRLTHDFAFPTIEGFPATGPFVQMFLRKGRVVRIDAPGFAPQNGENPMAGMLGGMAGLSALEQKDAPEGEEASLPIPQIAGTFTLTVPETMDIRANNTDEGPRDVPGAKVLEWDISPRTRSAPTALIAY